MLAQSLLRPVVAEVPHDDIADELAAALVLVGAVGAGLLPDARHLIVGAALDAGRVDLALQLGDALVLGLIGAKVGELGLGGPECGVGGVAGGNGLKHALVGDGGVPGLNGGAHGDERVLLGGTLGDGDIEPLLSGCDEICDGHGDPFWL